MYNIAPSILVYFLETLISYVFFSRVSKSKYKLWKSFLIGFGIFFDIHGLSTLNAFVHIYSPPVIRVMLRFATLPIGVTGT